MFSMSGNGNNGRFGSGDSPLPVVASRPGKLAEDPPTLPDRGKNDSEAELGTTEINPSPLPTERVAVKRRGGGPTIVASKAPEVGVPTIAAPMEHENGTALDDNSDDLELPPPQPPGTTTNPLEMNLQKVIKMPEPQVVSPRVKPSLPPVSSSVPPEVTRTEPSVGDRTFRPIVTTPEPMPLPLPSPKPAPLHTPVTAEVVIEDSEGNQSFEDMVQTIKPWYRTRTGLIISIVLPASLVAVLYALGVLEWVYLNYQLMMRL